MEKTRLSRSHIVFAVLGGFFLTNALVAELIGAKLIYVADPEFKIGPIGPFAMSVGVIPWPIVFITTDLVNEYFGRKGVRRLTFLTAAMLIYAYVVLFFTMQVPAASFSGVDDQSYNRVFGQSQWIIVGSLCAFLISQLIDVFVFHFFRRRTGKSRLWLRATGSTVVSQMIDSVVVLWIGLALPLQWTMTQFVAVAAPNYLVKLFLALCMTPVIYFIHWLVERYLGHDVAEELAEQAATASGREPKRLTLAYPHVMKDKTSLEET